MDSDLRIPLSALPGLDPSGLFLWRHGTAQFAGWCTTWASGTGRVWLHGWDEDGIDPDRVSLDLSDAASRSRVARWVVRQVVGHHVPESPSGDSDDTRLPDGSRRIDAIALGKVAVHLGGTRG